MSLIKFKDQPGNAALEGLVVAKGAAAPISLPINLAAVADPTVNDDSTATPPWQVGSRWIRPGTQSEFICFDNSAGAAVWVKVNASSSGTALKETIAVANAFASGNAIRRTSSGYVKAQGNSAANADVLGVIESVSGGTSFTVVYQGKCTVTAHGFTIGDYLYLDASTAGALTATPPSTAGQVNKPVAIGLDANTLLVAQLRGFVVPTVTVTPVNVITTCNFRLSPVSGVPVPNSDILTGLTTLYGALNKGDQIALFDTASGLFIPRQSGELPINLAGLPANTPHDIFFYWDGAAIQYQFAAWTSTIARASALGYQNGVLCLNSDKTRRLVGSFCTTSSVGTTEWSLQNRLIWNMYDRKPVNLFKTDATTSWSTTNTSFRFARNQATNMVSLMNGLAEDNFKARVQTMVGNSAAASASVGVGIDNNTNVARITPSIGVGGPSGMIIAEHAAILPIGFHSIYWLERTNGNPVAFFGTHGIDASDVSGILAEAWL